MRRQYRHAQGFSDAGEEAALEFLRPSLLAARVLDLGVGTGRTTALLAPAAAIYFGIDSSPEMIELARARHPGADLRVGDARELSDLPDGGFDLVVFSFNGIDSVDRAGRVRVLAEAHRVLAPHGLLLFSTLNLDGANHGETPATLRAIPGPGLRHPRAEARRLGALVRAFWYFRRSSRKTETGPGWSRRPIAAHEFRFVVHFTRLGAAIRLLRNTGFDVRAAWGQDGRPLDLDAETCEASYMHIVAARSVPPGLGRAVT